MSWLNDYIPNKELCDKQFLKYQGQLKGYREAKLKSSNSNWKRKEDKSK